MYCSLGDGNMAIKFNYYDIVRIKTNHPEKNQFNGREGFVLGISEPISNREPGYAVHLEGENGWYFMESELEPTGKKYEGNDYQSIKTTHPTSNPKLSSPYDEPIEFTQKQILHSIHIGLYDSGVELDEATFEKLLRALAATFEIDKNYVNMFVKAKMRKNKKLILDRKDA
jgi:hypothetical protein